ncbi:uncharacterized protein [Amphiura filiformis]|uniref:uncharacterized protein n=1 Tax=Amphiura filiformis TaxID=82378 RepID=UPI003B219CFB
MASTTQLLVTFICTLFGLVTAKWPPPGQVCPCTCSLSMDPQLTYALGPGQYKQVDCRGLGLREIPSDFPLDTDVVLLSNNNIGNLITDNLDEIRTLLYLDLSHNQIKKVAREPFRYNTKLKFLNLGWNRIENVVANAFAPLQKLNRLLMPSNALARIPTAISNLSALTHVDLSKNRLTTIDQTALQKTPLVQFLNLESNMISAIDANIIRQLPQLISLMLTQNQISYLPTYMFHGMQNLEHIALGANNIVNLPGIIFRGAPRLRKIDLHQNRLTYLDPQLFHGMRTLEEVHLNQNRLLMMPPGIFQGLRNLAIIDLAGNTGLQTLPVGIFRGLLLLEEIHLSHLQQIPEGIFWGLNAVETVSITNSYITPVLGSIFRDLSLLQELNLASNGIEVIPDNLFENMNYLEMLDLSSNQLTHFSMAWFGGRTLNNFGSLLLQNNRIEDLPAEAFVEMPYLQQLNLEGNQLSEINDNIFPSRSQIDTLLLSNNRIRRVYPGIVPKLINVEKLTVSNNKLTCDCHLKPFAEYLKMHVEVVEAPNELVCAVPKLYQHQQIIKLIESPQNPFTCVFPQIMTRPRQRQLNLNYGGSTQLSCYLSDSAAADIIWRLPDGSQLVAPFLDPTSPVASRPRVYARASGDLVLQNFDQRDTGIYTCQTVNTVGSDEITYDMRIILPVQPRPTVPRPPITAPRYTPKPTTRKLVPRFTVRPATVRVTQPRFPTARTAIFPSNRVTIAPRDRITDKIGTAINRTTLMTFTLPPTTLPVSHCNPNPCQHGGTCKIVAKQFSTDSYEDGSEESYYSSSVMKQGERMYNALPSGGDQFKAECQCRKKWGGAMCQYKKPEMPGTIKILEVDSNLITLTWSQIKHSNNIQGYRILYSKVGDRTIVKSMPIHPQVSSYTMEKLSNDATYRICVVAFNMGGESAIGEQNCVWAETTSQASGLTSLFNIQLFAIGGGCLLLLILLILSLYCYQRMQKKRQDEVFADDVLVRHPVPRPHSSASEMIRRSMRRPTASFYANNDDVMLIDLANQAGRQMYMNPFDSNRHSMLFSDLERSGGSHGNGFTLPESPRLFQKPKPRKTLKIQDDTPL